MGAAVGGASEAEVEQSCLVGRAMLHNGMKYFFSILFCFVKLRLFDLLAALWHTRNEELTMRKHLPKTLDQLIFCKYTPVFDKCSQIY